MDIFGVTSPAPAITVPIDAVIANAASSTIIAATAGVRITLRSATLMSPDLAAGTRFKFFTTPGNVEIAATAFGGGAGQTVPAAPAYFNWEGTVLPTGQGLVLTNLSGAGSSTALGSVTYTTA